MLMAQILTRVLLDKDWRVGDLDSCRESEAYCQILRSFADHACPSCPYSIHHIVHCGIKYDKIPGEWFGPGTAALVLRDITDLVFRRYHGHVQLMVMQSNTVYMSDVEVKMKAPRTSVEDEIYHGEARAEPITTAETVFFDPLLHQPPSSSMASTPWQSPLAILIPLRLGISSVSREYVEELKAALRTSWCAGILGGKPNHAIYFVGYRNGRNSEHLLGLDPHVVHYAMSVAQPFPSPELFQEVHVEDLEEMRIEDLDPSMTIAYYFKDEEDFAAFCAHYHQRSGGNRPHSVDSVGGSGGEREVVRQPLFSVEHSPPSLAALCSFDDDDDNKEGDDNIEDEYVML